MSIQRKYIVCEEYCRGMNPKELARMFFSDPIFGAIANAYVEDVVRKNVKLKWFDEMYRTEKEMLRKERAEVDEKRKLVKLLF